MGAYTKESFEKQDCCENCGYEIDWETFQLEIFEETGMILCEDCLDDWYNGDLEEDF